MLNQTLKEIRQELARAEVTAVSDEEYIAMLSQHTSNLAELVENMNVTSSYPGNFQSILNLLFKNITEPVIVVDENLHALFVNPYWEKHIKKACTKEDLQDLVNKSEYKILQNAIRESLREEKRKIVVLTIGEQRKIVSIFPFQDFDNAPMFLLVAFGEEFITQIAQVKKSDDLTECRGFKDNDAGNYHFLDLIDGFHFTLDQDLYLQSVSSSISAELGWKESELICTKLTEILNPESAAKVEKALMDTANSSNQKKLRLEVEMKDSKGNFFFYEISIRKDSGKNLWSGLCLNIHERVMQTEKLTCERNNAELNDKRKSDFLVNMSHEIRTPLNGIVGFSTMLDRDDINSEKREKYLRIIRSSTAHLLSLVNDIIDHSKIEAGQLKLNYHRVNVGEVLDDLLATFISEAKRLRKNQLRIIKQVPSDRKKLAIRCDETRIRQVLNNLMGNAIKFTETGEITFGYTLESEKQIRFFVRDNGVGLSEEAQKMIFRRFKQTGEGQKDKHDGYGLGLSISKGIIELMKGRIGVTSESGKGAEFYFTLPLEEWK